MSITHTLSLSFSQYITRTHTHTHTHMHAHTHTHLQVDALARSSLIAPVFFTVCGVKRNQATLITRSRKREHHRWYTRTLIHSHIHDCHVTHATTHDIPIISIHPSLSFSFTRSRTHTHTHIHTHTHTHMYRTIEDDGDIVQTNIDHFERDKSADVFLSFDRRAVCVCACVCVYVCVYVFV